MNTIDDDLAEMIALDSKTTKTWQIHVNPSWNPVPFIIPGHSGARAHLISYGIYIRNFTALSYKVISARANLAT